jgi:hypothetical protein
MNENITVAVFYTKTCTLDNYLRQEYLKVKLQPTRLFIQGVPEPAPQRKQACADNKRDSKLTKINFLLAQITEL